MTKLPPGKFWSHNVDIAGYCDFDGKPAFKLAIQEYEGRWYLYVAHLWHRGWSIVDVTDPAAPRPVRFIEGPDNTWTIQLQVADGLMITGLERMAPGWGRRCGGAIFRGSYHLGCSQSGRSGAAR